MGHSLQDRTVYFIVRRCGHPKLQIRPTRLAQNHAMYKNVTCTITLVISAHSSDSYQLFLMQVQNSKEQSSPECGVFRQLECNRRHRDVEEEDE